MIVRGAEAAYRVLRSVRATTFVLGCFAVTIGVLYLPNVVNDIDRVLTAERYIPLPLWSALWLVMGAGVLAAAVSGRCIPAAAGAITGVTFAWSLTYLMAWVTGNSERGIVTAVVFGLIAYLTTAFFARVTVRSDRADPKGREVVLDD